MEEFGINLEGVSKETALKLLELQPRCVNCGSTYGLHLHHRIFRSEGEEILKRFLLEMKKIYEDCYGKELVLWGLHDIQNLCVLCRFCHEGENGVHGGNEGFRQLLRNSFTCKITGFNIPFYRIKNKLW